MADVKCNNCGKVIASAQWFGRRNTRTRSYHEQSHCTKKLGAFRLDRYILDKEHAVDYIAEMERFCESNPKWVKYPKRLAHVQAHCPHKETYTLYYDNGDGQEFWTLRCKRCFKALEEEHQPTLIVSV